MLRDAASGQRIQYTAYNQAYSSREGVNEQVRACAAHVAASLGFLGAVAPVVTDYVLPAAPSAACEWLQAGSPAGRPQLNLSLSQANPHTSAAGPLLGGPEVRERGLRGGLHGLHRGGEPLGQRASTCSGIAWLQ